MNISPRALMIAVFLFLVLLGGAAYLALRRSPMPDSTAPVAPVASEKSYSPQTNRSAPAPYDESRAAAGIMASRTPRGVMQTTESVARRNTAAAETSAPDPDAPTAVPALFADPDPSLKLNQEQLDEIENLRQQFVDAVGGENQNPNDPEYLRRWRKAQPEFDQRLKALLGTAVYNRLKSEAERQQPGAAGQPGQ